VPRLGAELVAKPSNAASEYTPEQRLFIDREIAKGLEDVKKGRTYGPFNTVEEMAASIEANIQKRHLHHHQYHSAPEIDRLTPGIRK